MAAMTLKERSLIALRCSRMGSFLYQEILKWKQDDSIPDEFKVLIFGPPKSHKTALGSWIAQLWPRVTVIEKHAAQVTWEMAAGFPVVLRTSQVRHAAPSGLLSHWEFVEVVKCRWRASDPAKRYSLMPLPRLPGAR